MTRRPHGWNRKVRETIKRKGDIDTKKIERERKRTDPRHEPSVSPVVGEEEGKREKGVLICGVNILASDALRLISILKLKPHNAPSG